MGNHVHSVVACFRESEVDDVLREEVVGAQAAGRAIDIQGFVGLDILGGELEQFAAVRASQQDEAIVVARHPHRRSARLSVPERARPYSGSARPSSLPLRPVAEEEAASLGVAPLCL